MYKQYVDSIYLKNMVRKRGEYKKSLLKYTIHTLHKRDIVASHDNLEIYWKKSTYAGSLFIGKLPITLRMANIILRYSKLNL